MVVYCLGVIGTFLHWCRDAFREMERGHMPSPNYEWFMAFMTLVWPVYWAGRVLWAPVDRLLLPSPGDDVP